MAFELLNPLFLLQILLVSFLNLFLVFGVLFLKVGDFRHEILDLILHRLFLGLFLVSGPLRRDSVVNLPSPFLLLGLCHIFPVGDLFSVDLFWIVALRFFLFGLQGLLRLFLQFLLFLGFLPILLQKLSGNLFQDRLLFLLLDALFLDLVQIDVLKVVIRFFDQGQIVVK